MEKSNRANRFSTEVVLFRLRSGLPTHLCGLSFKGQGAFSTQWGVSPSWIIEPVDILKYPPFGLASCFPTIAPDHLRLDGFEECFDHGIVITIPFAAH